MTRAEDKMKLRELLVDNPPTFASAVFKVGDRVFLSDRGRIMRACRSTSGLVVEIRRRSPLVYVWPDHYLRAQEYHCEFWSKTPPMQICPTCSGTGKIALEE